MRIFEFQVNGEKEWIAANNIFEAISTYEETTTINIVDEATIDDDLVEIPEHRWNHEKMIYKDEPGRPEKTFREIVSEMNGPGYMGSTVND